ncbi:MAG: polyketide cyclase [Acidimicrobiia bacterium]|nr:polyketide cyclase [Acidimicrobiia bacterium]
MNADAHDYHFVTRWRVPGTCGEVADVLGDPVALPHWWPSVYLRVDQLEPPGPDGVGRRVRLHTKGWLPYTLTWELVTVEQAYPNRIVLDASGDFVGRGVWTFVQDGPDVSVIYDWRIHAEKPLLRHLSWLLRPIFEANHRWAMAQGEASLRLELQRRRTVEDVDRSAIPAPPGPVTYSAALLVGGLVVVAAGTTYLMYRATRRRRGDEH